MKNKKEIFVWVLIYLQFFLSLGGLVTGPMLMIRPDGSIIQMPLSVMRGSPFTDFFIPGLILFLLLGIFPMLIAFGIWKKPAWSILDVFNPFKQMHWSWAGSLAAGIIVIIWLSVELIWVQYFLLHTIYYLWGGLIIVLTLLSEVCRYLRKEL